MTRERAESEWVDEHPQYDIESEDFPSHVGEVAQAVYRWEIDTTREQLEVEAPHRVYVVDTYSRIHWLVNVLRSLSIVEKMLTVDTFPVETPGGKIHREAWLRITIDACVSLDWTCRCKKKEWGVSDSSIRVSEALMAELQRAADVEQRSPEEVVEDAVERYLRLKRRDGLYAYGEGQAERLGIKEEDVPALVKEIRRDTSAPGR